MKHAVVTGANGFVGSALCRELANNGVEVTAVVRSAKSDLSRLGDASGIHIVCCDMERLSDLPALFDGNRPDVFYHLAWEGSTGSSRADYGMQLRNAKWSLDAVKAAAELGCERYVGAGTLAEKDVLAYSPLDGATPNAVSCYGAAKLAAHLMTKAECASKGVAHLWAELSNTYGIGNFTSNFINFASKKMITGQSADFTSGEQPYDFVNIADTAQGLRCIGESGKTNCSYYIGSGHSRPLKEFIRILRDVIDPAIELHLGAVPFNGTAQPPETFDCGKLISDTGYCPKVAFENGAKETVRWLREQIAEGRI